MSKNKELTFKDLRDANSKRDQEVYKDLPEWSTMQWACALCGEAGEFANKAKKLWKVIKEIEGLFSRESLIRHDITYDELEEEREYLVDSMAEELADVLIYVDLCAQHLNVDLQEVLILKFNKKSLEVKSSVFLGGAQ